MPFVYHTGEVHVPSEMMEPGKSALPQLAYSLASSMRHAYQTPRQSRNLKGNTTRYGCSVDIVRPACGVVPTLHTHSLPAGYQTWYSTEFGGSRGAGTMTERPPSLRPKAPLPVRLPPIDGHKLKSRVMPVKGGERGNKNPSHSRRQRASGNTKVTGDAKTVMYPQKAPIWLSEWTGPM